MTNRILLIDDDDSLRRVTEYNLKTAGFEVISAASGGHGLTAFTEHSPNLVVCDVKLGDMDGLELLRRFKEQSPEVPVIIITAFGSIEMAVKAMRLGAFTFITKPFDRDALRLSCEKALEMQNLHRRADNLTREINRLTGVEGMETANSAMAELLDTAARAAESDATILITGESGTGKEVLARLIHQHSPRRNESFVGVNCAAIPATLMESELFGHVKGAFTGAIRDRKGRFQLARKGTLFLDEIAELQPETQVKFLRVLQEKKVEPVGGEHSEEVDARIIAATNRNPREDITTGRFREDLFYRLSVIPLHLPPLRERAEDIPALAQHFLKRHQAPANVSLSPEALVKLRAYHWPGNIRELQNVIERGLILRRGNVITPDDIPLHTERTTGPASPEFDIPDQGISLEEVEKNLIRKALAKSGGNRSQAARLLHIPRHVLIYRLEKFGIEN